MIVNLGRVEGIMPRSEQIPGEQHEAGERIQALILEVRDTPSAVKIILSRSHPELIRRLFEREVPEVGERTIEIKALAREPGHRTKIARQLDRLARSTRSARASASAAAASRTSSTSSAARRSTSSAGTSRRRS